MSKLTRQILFGALKAFLLRLMCATFLHLLNVPIPGSLGAKIALFTATVIVAQLAICVMRRVLPSRHRQRRSDVGSQSDPRSMGHAFVQASVESTSRSVQATIPASGPPPARSVSVQATSASLPHQHSSAPVAGHQPPLLGPNNTITDGYYIYHVQEVLGAGAFGRVVAAIRVDPHTHLHTHVAIKVMHKNAARGDDLLALNMYNEGTMLRWCADHNTTWLMRSLGIFQDEWNVYYVMEQCAGTLSHLAYVRNSGVRRPLATLRRWAAELVLGIEELQKLGIIHRDLKPDNILVDVHGHLVISDFGIADAVHIDPGYTLYDYPSTWAMGTIQYEAPEVFDASQNRSYTCASDMWSLGVTLLEMFYGQPYFAFHDVAKAEREVRTKDFEHDINIYVDPAARSLIRDLLQRDPSMRPTVQQIKNYEFFRNCDWDAIRAREAPGVTPYIPPLTEEQRRGAENALKFKDTLFTQHLFDQRVEDARRY